MTTRGRDPSSGLIRTFLIADIRGYTTFTAKFGDEAATRLARKFAQVVAEGVEAWGGVLVELRGDEALAVFDSARYALQAAAELQDAFADETRADPRLPLPIGMGLDAGEALPVGDGYRGAALNLASRLCATAQAGEIRITESLAHLAGPVAGLSFVRQAAAEFKGIVGSVVPILVISDLKSDPTKGDQPPRTSTAAMPAELDSFVPFAGRTRELRWLAWHWRRARHGHSRAVVVAGPTGIGKTRLAAEIAGAAQRDGADVVYWPSRNEATAELIATWSTDDRPALFVLDDLELASQGSLSEIEQGIGALGDSTLAVITHGDSVPIVIAELVARLEPTGQLELSPLDSEAIRAIVALYAESSDDVPMGMIEAESDGVPAAVHRVASQWARTQAMNRLGTSAQETAVGRRRLRAAEATMIDDVTDLERVRERTRLFAADPEDGETIGGAVICPYKGLAAFERTDSEYFFGRDRLVAELVARLVGSPFVAVVGASGTGKSSVIRAGLLPALASGVLPASNGWIQVVTRPGEHPLEELRAALSRALPGQAQNSAAELLAESLARLSADQRVVLVVDQFEELFTTAVDEDERTAFVDLLTGSRPGLKVIVALRADHYGHCAAYPALARLLGTDQILVGPVTAAELAAIVERPAHSVGLRVEPELTDTLVADAGAEPGALPLLSTALLELWHARSDGRLTLASYLARGGLRGAVARLAESAFRRLTPEQQLTARAVLLRLAGPGQGDTLVRRRVPLSEFDTDRNPQVDEVLAVLTAQRLLSSGDGYVEVAHEALLREWPRLQAWLADDAAGRSVRLHIIGAARDWEERGRELGDLYRGARLAAVVDWAAEHESELNAVEREFLAESRSDAEREADRQRRSNRRLRTLLAGATVLLVAAIAAGGFAFLQSQQAQAEAVRADEAAAQADLERAAAERAQAIARSRELAASAISYADNDPSLSKLLALAAASIADPPIEVISALHEAWSADRIVYRYAWPEDRRLDELAADISPDGRLIAAGGFGTGILDVIDWASGEVVWSFDAGGDAFWMGAPIFSRDGAFLVASVEYDPADTDSPALPTPDSVGLFIWEAATGDLVRRLDGGACGPGLVSLGDTRAMIVTLPDDQLPAEAPCVQADKLASEVIDLVTGERNVMTLNVGSGAVSADGRIAAFEDFASDPARSVVVDLESGEEVLEIDPLDTSRALNNYTRALNADGSLLLYGDRPQQIWDTDAGAIIATFDGHAGESVFGTFSADGRSVYSTGRDSTLRHWDARTGEEIARYAGISGARAAVAAGLALVSRPEGTSVLLELGPRGEAGAIATCHGFVPAGNLDVVGDTVAAAIYGCGGADPAVGYSLIAGLESRSIVSSTEGMIAQTQALSPDGTRFARQEGSGFDFGGVFIRDARTGDTIVELEGTCPYDDNVRDEETGLPVGCHVPPGIPFAVFAAEVSWSPDGTKLVISNGVNAGGGFVVWDASTGNILLARGEQYTGSTIFTPDGNEVVVATQHEDISPDGSMHVLRFDLESGAMIEDVDIGDIGNPELMGYSADHQLLYLMDRRSWDQGGGLVALQFDGLQEVRRLERTSEGSIKSGALNPARTRIATGSSDGFVRIWDAETFALVHEFNVGDTQVQGVAWATDTELAVIPEEGDILVFTTDVEDLLSTVRASLTRGFTEAECERFNFGDSCPTLEQLRAGG